MAKHFKEKPRSARGAVIAVAIVAAVAVVVGCCFLVANSGALYAIADLFNETPTTTTGEAESTSTTTATPEPEPEPVYALPDTMKGVWLAAGTDYFISGKESAATVKKQIDTAFDSIDEWEFNTLFLPLHREEKALYASTEMDSLLLSDGEERFDPLAYIIGKARERKLYVYGVLDLHVRDSVAWDPRVDGVIERTVRIAAESAKQYAFDGMYVTGFAYTIDQLKKEERAEATVAVDKLVTQVAQTLTASDRNLFVGLLSNGVWAHKSVNALGSDTAGYYEEYTDGCANTLDWLKRGLFHGVTVCASSSTSHASASFQKVLAWWDGVAEELQLPLYISHAADNVGSHLAGWKAPDQLAQQYLYCKESAQWKGSVYKSLSALCNDTLGAAETLKKAYSGTLNEEFIYKQLTVSSPSKTTVTTIESVITFEGGGDTNFPITINGEAVELSEHGFFTKRYTLSIGVNTFTFTHKGKTVVYKVTYKQTLLTEVSPAENMTVDGGSEFLVRAIAREGATVKAVIHGTTVTMKPTGNTGEERGETPTGFCEYMGQYTLPKGVVGQAQALGAITVTATYNGFSESKKGGSITVEALPTPTTTQPTTKPTGGEVTAPPSSEATPPAAGTADIVVITSEYAETFNGGSSVDDYSRPYNSYLPKGTQDTLVKKVYNGSKSYYLLGSGKRVYQKDAKVVKGALNPNQSISAISAEVSGMYTEVTVSAGWDVPVYIVAAPQQYYNDTTAGKPNYNINRHGQQAEYVDVTFHYISRVPDAPKLDGNPLFSSAKWIDGGGGKWTLRLTLKHKGDYYGHQLVWTGNTLSLSFLNPVDISQNPPEAKLKGIRVLIDPGHGTDYDKPAEAPFNLNYANELKAKLEALGATVVMTRTTHLGGKKEENLPLAERVAMLHAGSYHMLISVHMNGYDGTEVTQRPTGASVYYYDEVGYTLASYVYPKMHAVETTYGVGTTANGKPRADGTAWDKLYMNRCVFDCPSILLECAFLDNPKDKEALIDPVYRNKLMQAVADGVVAYFEAMK